MGCHFSISKGWKTGPDWTPSSPVGPRGFIEAVGPSLHLHHVLETLGIDWRHWAPVTPLTLTTRSYNHLNATFGEMRVHQKSHEKKETLTVALMRVELGWPQSVVSILPADGRARTARVTPRLPVPSWMAQSSTCQASKKSPVPWPPYIFWMPGLACKTGNLADDISQRTSAVSCIFSPTRSAVVFYGFSGCMVLLTDRQRVQVYTVPLSSQNHRLHASTCHLSPSEPRHKVFNVHHLDAFGSSFPAPAWNTRDTTEKCMMDPDGSKWIMINSDYHWWSPISLRVRNHS